MRTPSRAVPFGTRLRHSLWSRHALCGLGLCAWLTVGQPAPALAGADGPGGPESSDAASVPAAPLGTAVRQAASEAAQAGGGQAATSDPVLSFFKKVEFSGLVDAYYTYHGNEPETGTFTPYRNFDVRHNQFSVALLEFAMSKPATAEDRTGFRFDLNYGQVAQIFSSDPLDGNALVNVQQAYISYLAPVGKGLTFEVGKFVTPIGTEATEANLNNNYSRAFLYALGPYYHTGARVSYAFTPQFTLGGMIVNGWNATGDNNAGKSYGISATVVPTPKLTIIQNLLVGPEQAGNADDMRTYSDTNLAATLSDKVTAGLNYVYARDTVSSDGIKWQGLALYFKGQLTKTFALSPRFEWYDDQDGFASGTPQALKEFTLTAETKHSSGLIMRLEYRRDWSDEDVFFKNGLAVNNQNTLTLGFIYAFTSKAP